MKRIFLIATILALIPCAALAIFGAPAYEWGYTVSDEENYPKNVIPDNRPKAFILDYAANYRVSKNPNHENIIVYLPLPANNRLYQKVLSYSLDPAPEKIIQSKYGYKIAVFNFGPLAKDMPFGVRYHAEVEIYEVNVPLYPEQVGTTKDIPKQIKKDYLRNGRWYRMKDPAIVAAAKEAVGDETNLLEKVRKIWLYVRSRLTYVQDGRKDNAPQILFQGHGTCTEYSFAMIALCRVNGIPARYISGSKIRMSKVAVKATDRVFHKIVEVYLPGYGWLPMESTAGGGKATEKEADRQIGKLRPRMLFFQYELEPGLAPLDPRKNTLTWIGQTKRTRIRLTGETVGSWEKVKIRAE